MNTTARDDDQLADMVSTLTCKRCGDEATVVGDYDDFTDELVSWEEAHRHCGEPEKTIEHTVWSELVDQGIHSKDVQHDGDASKVMPQPRPSWSDPAHDHVGSCLSATTYRSPVVPVAATHSQGWIDDETLDHPSVDVQAKLYGNDVRLIGVRITKPTGESSIHLAVEEARQLARVLNAACDLVVTE